MKKYFKDNDPYELRNRDVVSNSNVISGIVGLKILQKFWKIFSITQAGLAIGSIKQCQKWWRMNWDCTIQYKYCFFKQTCWTFIFKVKGNQVTVFRSNKELQHPEWNKKPWFTGVKRLIFQNNLRNNRLNLYIDGTSQLSQLKLGKRKVEPMIYEAIMNNKSLF